MSHSPRFPRLRDVLDAGSSKTAGTLPDPGPDNHPASADPGNMPVAEKETITDAAKKSIAARGHLSVENQDGPIVDKGAVTINTETGKDGDELRSEIPINDGIKDPGPDSEHPAHVPTEKYASCQNATDVALVIEEALRTITSKLASVAKLAGETEGSSKSQTKDPLLENSDDVPESDDEDPAPLENKIASVLNELVPDVVEEDGVSYRAKMAQFLQNELAPYVETGVRRGENLVAFLKLAEMDPAAAEMIASGGGGEEIPPELLAEEAAMGGGEGGGGEEDQIMQVVQQISQETGMPPDQVVEQMLMELGGEGGGGGAPAAAGGGSEEDALLEAVNMVAQEQGIPPEQVMEMLLSEGGGGGDPAAAAAASGPAPGPAPEMPPEAMPKEASFNTEDPVAAAARVKQETQLALRRKLAEHLLGETGKTPMEVARNC